MVRTTALELSVAKAKQPGPLQQRFHDLMAQVDACRALQAHVRSAMDRHVPAHRQAMRSLHDEKRRWNTCLVVALDGYAQGADGETCATAQQRQQAVRVLRWQCQRIGHDADPQVRAIAARYEDDNDAQERVQAMEEVQEALAAYVGGDFAQGRVFDSPQQALAAAWEYEQRQHQAKTAKRDAKRAVRKAKKSADAASGGTADDGSAQPVDARQMLRAVFRQLVSALHPDREADAVVRERKTAWMCEVNTAYDQQDINRLLRIQWQLEMSDACRAAGDSDAKLKALCDGLAKQAKALQAQVQELREGMQAECGYLAHQPFEEVAWLALLRQRQAALQAQVDQLAADVRLAQGVKTLPVWIKEQIRAYKAEQSQQHAAPVMDAHQIVAELVRQHRARTA